jgi:hypothetical protein
LTGPRSQPRPNLRERQRAAQEAALRAASYDAYPDHVPPARERLALVIVDGTQIVDGEFVDLDGYELDEFIQGLGNPIRQRFLSDRLVQANHRFHERERADADGGDG